MHSNVHACGLLLQSRGKVEREGASLGNSGSCDNPLGERGGSWGKTRKGSDTCTWKEGWIDWTIESHLASVGYNASVANQSEPEPGWICSKESELTFSVLKQSFYAVVVLPPSISDNVKVKYWYQSNITHKGIQISSLTPCPNSSLSGCTFHVRKHLPFEERCIIAHTNGDGDLQEHDAYIRIQITFTVWSGLALFVCLGAVLVLASLVPCIVLCRRPLRRRMVALPSDIIHSASLWDWSV